jgi:hypothetical protein
MSIFKKGDIVKLKNKGKVRSSNAIFVLIHLNEYKNYNKELRVLATQNVPDYEVNCVPLKDIKTQRSIWFKDEDLELVSGEERTVKVKESIIKYKTEF